MNRLTNSQLAGDAILGLTWIALVAAIFIRWLA